MTRFVRASSLAFVLAACGGGGDNPASVCVPGTTMACVCAGGASGGQACLGDGSGYAACECGSSDEDGGTTREDMNVTQTMDMSVAEDMNVVAVDMDVATDMDVPVDAAVSLDASTPDLGADMATPMARLSAEFAFPGLVRDPGVVGGLEAAFPTYLAHLFGTWAVTAESLDDFTSFFPQTTCVEVTNDGDAPGMGQLEVRMPGYSDPSTQNVTVAAGESQVVCVNPTFNLTTLYGLTSPANGRIEVTFRVGGVEVASEMVSTRILPATYVLWQFDDTPDWEELSLARVLSSVYVQKDDPAIRASLTEVTSRVNYTSSLGASGYERAPVSSGARTLIPGDHGYESFFLEADEFTSWAMDAVAGGDNTIDIIVFKEAEYAKWASGESATGWSYPNQTTGSSVTFGHGSDEFEAGWYRRVYVNRPTNAEVRAFSVTRSPTRQQIVWDSLTAIFDALRARDISYTHIGDSFFAGAQNVRRVGQVFAEGTANCIDGSFVFASYLEAMALEPVLIYMEGHAIVGVRSMPTATDGAPHNFFWAIETTMLGTLGATASDAMWNAIATEEERRDTDPFWLEVDVANARTQQILPQPR